MRILVAIAEAIEKMPNAKYLYLHPSIKVDEHSVILMGVVVRRSYLMPNDIFLLLDNDPEKAITTQIK